MENKKKDKKLPPPKPGKKIKLKSNKRKAKLSSVDYKLVYRKFLVFIQKKSWLFTVSAFLIIFILSLFAWNKYIFSEEPDQQIVNEFQMKEEQINKKIERIERVIGSLNQRKERFNDVPDYSNVEGIFQSEQEHEIGQEISGGRVEAMQ